ncbi:MAG: hypothetical protein QGG63_01770 [Candidatus Pacebacteria bacterium]|jgi:hypothetical protein|nr:hypothetical protein [Candidatus Paceibacterota bacterium]|tara:strand:- start:61 stop:1047 length:987 start_codon:yes stop_codon:yes gene_type:complete
MNFLIKSAHNILLAIAALLFIAVLFYGAFFANGVDTAKAGSVQNMSGWAWSDNIGWISFNCTDTNSCGTVDYGVNAVANGNLSGYAWSDNVGWITFNESDLSGCPSGECTAKLIDDNLLGWARALSYGDEWDGWISLNGPNYGVVKNGNSLKEFAWDASAIEDKQIGIGWIEFDSLFGGVVFSSQNDPTVDISADPTLIFSGNNSTLSWTSTNATSCDASVGWSGSKELSGNEVVGPITNDTVYWLTCTNELSSASDSVTVFIDTSTQCSDGIDNDGDGQTDYPEDTSCSNDAGDDESIPVCGNTVCETGESAGNCSLDCGPVQFEEF